MTPIVHIAQSAPPLERPQILWPHFHRRRDKCAVVNMTHGLTARHARLLSEDPAEHEKHRQLFLSKFQPRDDFEYHLLIQLADLHWKLLRADTIDYSLLDLEVDKSADNPLRKNQCPAAS